MTRLRAVRHGADEGVSLVELLVSMLLVGILGTAIALSVSTLSRTDLKTTTRVRATDQAQVTIDRVSRVLRAATPVDGTVLLYADGTHVQLYADLGDPNGPEKVDLSAAASSVGTQMTQVTTRADAASTNPDATYTYTTQAPATAIDGGGIDTEDGGAIFTYYQMLNGKLTPVATPLSGSALLTKGVDAIGITLTDREPGVSARVQAKALVYLRSTEYGTKR